MTLRVQLVIELIDSLPGADAAADLDGKTDQIDALFVLQYDAAA